MPIYEFECSDCDHTYEEIRPMSDPESDACPSCDSTEVGRLVSRSSFQLKGGGWFDDDYSSASANEAGDSATDTESSTSTDDDTGEDKAPAAE